MWPCSVGHKVFESVERWHLSGDGAPATLASVCGARTPPREEKDCFWTKKNTDALRSLFSDSQHLSFLVCGVKVRGLWGAAADGNWFPSSPSDTPPVYSFTLWAPLPTLAFNYHTIAKTFLAHREAASFKCSCWSPILRMDFFIYLNRTVWLMSPSTLLFIIVQHDFIIFLGRAY